MSISVPLQLFPSAEPRILFTQLSRVRSHHSQLANTFDHTSMNCNVQQPLKVALLLASSLLAHSEWTFGQQSEVTPDTIQTGGSWWRELFGGGTIANLQNKDVQPDSSTTTFDHSSGDLLPNLNGLNTRVAVPETIRSEDSLSTTYVVRIPCEFEWNLPPAIAKIDSLSKVQPNPLQGFRVQIYFGDLQQARAIRAGFRRDHPGADCQLMAIDPNYAVTVGNYRDRWTAEKALRDDILVNWPRALVVPCEIDFPRLK